jgi:hypothetical protein
VTWKLKITAKGTLVAVRLAGSSAVGKGLGACMANAFHSVPWSLSDNGSGGWIRKSFTALIRRPRPRSN